MCSCRSPEYSFFLFLHGFAISCLSGFQNLGTQQLSKHDFRFYVQDSCILHSEKALRRRSVLSVLVSTGVFPTFSSHVKTKVRTHIMKTMHQRTSQVLLEKGQSGLTRSQGGLLVANGVSLDLGVHSVAHIQKLHDKFSCGNDYACQLVLYLACFRFSTPSYMQITFVMIDFKSHAGKLYASLGVYMFIPVTLMQEVKAFSDLRVASNTMSLFTIHIFLVGLHPCDKRKIIKSLCHNSSLSNNRDLGEGKEVEEVKKKVLKVPRVEQKVLDATSNEPRGPLDHFLQKPVRLGNRDS